ncbi:hypothetical protein HPB48_019260 [Haemaphysalis longicornis]|uniref:Uncharacterized protein n=1 Tax=Haemaphysalis longicornis TaxID=44386 RepID=A0A9J6GDS9_HAELO|nr:hypothetical protein HPB48_019260 [Haemaphysalis longicornis]
MGACTLPTAEATPGLTSRRDSGHLYGNGLFQLLTVMSTAVGSCLYVLHYESFKVTAGVMDHWCQRPDAFANLSVDEWKSLAIPLDDHGERSHCLVRDPPDGGENSSVVSCSSWEFDLAPFGNNAVSEWKLVCNRSWLRSFVRIAYALGAMIALPAAGVAADNVGRKTVTFLAVPVVLIAGVASSLPKDFNFFVAVGTAVSAATGALVPALWALLYEVSTPNMLVLYTVATAVAVILMIPATLFIADLISGGWTTIQLLLMVPTAFLLALYYTVDESPAWLIARGRIPEAQRVSLRAARLNRVELSRSREELLKAAGQPNQHKAGAQRFCGATLRGRMVLSCYMWVVLAFALENFIYNEGVEIGDITIALGLTLSAVTIVAGTFYLPRVGVKRAVILTGILFSSSMTLLAATYTRQRTLARDAMVTVVRVAGYSTYMPFFLMNTAMYPATARSTAIGTALSAARFGDTVAQLIMTPDHLKRVLIAVTAVLMALFVAAAEFLPEELEGAAQELKAVAKNGRKRPQGDLRRSFQSTLAPLPKKPIEARQDKTFQEFGMGSMKSSLWLSGRLR